jgi:hypothetical protein
MTTMNYFARWETPADYAKRCAAEWPIIKRGDNIAMPHGEGWAVFDKAGNAIGLGKTNSEAWLSVRSETRP